MMLWYAIRHQLDHDVLFCGNLMTEYMDTAEYRIYEGKNIGKALFGKETILDLTDNHTEVLDRLIDFYTDEDETKIITQRMLDRLVQLHVMKKFINWDYPVLNDNVLSELFAHPLEQRMNSRLTRNILTRYNRTLYKTPTGRSPLSLRYPLIIHQGYQKVSRRKVSKGLEHLLPTYMKENETVLKTLPDYGIVNEEKLNKFFHEEGRTYRIGMARLLNLHRWLKFNEKNLNFK